MKFIASILIILSLLPIQAQTKIKFEEVDHDFGEIREENGFAQHTFRFINEGDNPIRITNVKASCGCTTPGWTKEEVMPGDSGFVMARYNPRNRPGKFRKSLKITASDAASNQTLYIQGFVKPKPESPEKQFPVIIGDFRLASRTLNFGKINTEKPITKSFDIYNNSDSLTRLSSDSFFPKHLTAELSPPTLKPGEVGKLNLTYYPIKKNDFGFVSDNIRLSDGEGRGISVVAIVEEYFPEMTAEELDQAPKLALSDRVFDFEEVTQGNIIEAVFELSNVGKEELEFRAIKSSCDCVTYEFKSKALKKGRSRQLKVTFDTSDLRGNQYKSLTIYSNDPVNPTQIITLKGKVEK
ncbi:MAG: DUF1573 domain-containing protein [Ekhidna sp.]|nr:DUF1573 domain-containing protein [Ekhidna sp.]